MDLQELPKLLDAVKIGRVLLEKSGEPRLEAFSGNALYSRRGMPTMDKYKTVKEVCSLTGLTRKQLYYFHHEKVVRAVAYANHSVEGYNGYKLYDDIAVEKLQQIALYYQLGLKRNEIKDIMLSPNYDSNLILHTLLTMEQEKKIHIERHIAALEYLILAGTKNGVGGSLRGISLDELGRTLLTVREASAEDCSFHARSDEHAAIFARKFSSLIAEFARMDEAMLASAPGSMIIQSIFDLSNKYLGSDSSPFVLGLFMSVLGEGSIAQDITDQLSPAHARAVIHFPALFGRDAPVFHQAGALHQPHRQERQAQAGRVQLEHQHILRVILVDQLALLDKGAEPAGNVGVTGVDRVAVDVRLDAALADHHIPVAACRAGPDGKIGLALAQDLVHSGVGLAVGGKAAEADGIACFDILRDRVVQTHDFVHKKDLLDLAGMGPAPARGRTVNGRMP